MLVGDGWGRGEGGGEGRGGGAFSSCRLEVKA